MTHIKENQQKEKNNVIIIGGSLSGLMAAIALADEGANVIVLEKAKEGKRTGAGLQVDGESFNQTKTEKKLRHLASNGESTVQLWTNIESRLRQEAHNNSKIELHFDTRVKSIGQNSEKTWAKTVDNQTFEADILIGADGHSSMVRNEVAPQHPDANYAGYLVWMASVDENELEKDKRPDVLEKQVQMFNRSGGFMFASVISDEHNKRRIGCTWYDNTKNDLLEKLGAIEGRLVHHSIDGKDLSEKDLQSLIQEAKGKWPEPWRTATVHALGSRDFIGIPIKEYVPERLINNRLALVGDAAHVPAPITASGFNESLIDAVILSECISNGLGGTKANEALLKYENLRLKKVQAMVRSGQSFSRSFGRQ